MFGCCGMLLVSDWCGGFGMVERCIASNSSTVAGMESKLELTSSDLVWQSVSPAMGT
jgi:hypothetical protein